MGDAETYLVGGSVRDVYLRRPIHDIDLATPGDGRVVARRIANAFDGDYYPLDGGRGVGRALLQFDGQQYIVDVAQFRQGSLQGDLHDRDFTMNAMAVDLRQLDAIFDPTGGLHDIRRKMVRMCHADAITNDPVRALRAVRLSISHRFHVDDDTKAAIRANVSTLGRVSNERIRDELFKLFDGPRTRAAILSLQVLGLLEPLLPGCTAMLGVEQSPPHVYDVWRHTLNVVDFMDMLLAALGNRRDDNTAANFGLGMVNHTLSHIRSHLIDHIGHQWPNERSHRALLIMAALAHDIGKPTTKTTGDDGRIHFYNHEQVGRNAVGDWALQLALSNDETQRLQQIVQHHLRPSALARNDSVSRRSVYRFWRDTGPSGVDVCLLSIADQLGKYGTTLQQPYWLHFMDVLRSLLDAYFLENDNMVVVKPLLNGDDIMRAFNVQPGPLMGVIIGAMREAQATQEISTVEEAHHWLGRWLERHHNDS